jgi:hypothetical protein
MNSITIYDWIPDRFTGSALLCRNNPVAAMSPGCSGSLQLRCLPPPRRTPRGGFNGQKSLIIPSFVPIAMHPVLPGGLVVREGGCTSAETACSSAYRNRGMPTRWGPGGSQEPHGREELQSNSSNAESKERQTLVKKKMQSTSSQCLSKALSEVSP